MKLDDDLNDIICYEKDPTQDNRKIALLEEMVVDLSLSHLGLHSKTISASGIENWEYVVLSRVFTLKGMFLFQLIDMEEAFKPTDDLKQFMKQTE